MDEAMTTRYFLIVWAFTREIRLCILLASPEVSAYPPQGA
jgi:hypothetical protein